MSGLPCCLAFIIKVDFDVFKVLNLIHYFLEVLVATHSEYYSNKGKDDTPANLVEVDEELSAEHKVKACGDYIEKMQI